MQFYSKCLLSDSPDSGFHRITPLPHSGYSPSNNGLYGRDSHLGAGHPDHHSHHNHHQKGHHHHGHHHHQSGRSGHLNDITASMAQNVHHPQVGIFNSSLEQNYSQVQIESICK